MPTLDSMVKKAVQGIISPFHLDQCNDALPAELSGTMGIQIFVCFPLNNGYEVLFHHLYASVNVKGQNEGYTLPFPCPQTSVPATANSSIPVMC